MTKKIEFTISDDLTPVSGIAVLHCVDAKGEPVIAEADYGDKEMLPAEVIGLLTVTVDQYRYDFVDPGGRANVEDRASMRFLPGNIGGR